MKYYHDYLNAVERELRDCLIGKDLLDKTTLEMIIQEKFRKVFSNADCISYFKVEENKILKNQWFVRGYFKNDSDIFESTSVVNIEANKTEETNSNQLVGLIKNIIEYLHTGVQNHYTFVSVVDCYKVPNATLTYLFKETKKNFDNRKSGNFVKPIEYKKGYQHKIIPKFEELGTFSHMIGVSRSWIHGSLNRYRFNRMYEHEIIKSIEDSFQHGFSAMRKCGWSTSFNIICNYRINTEDVKQLFVNISIQKESEIMEFMTVVQIILSKEKNPSDDIEIVNIQCLDSPRDCFLNKIEEYSNLFRYNDEMIFKFKVKDIRNTPILSIFV